MNCLLRPLLVFWLIVYSVRYRTRPWNFFQLNARYFDSDKGIFSKLAIDRLIPSQWRLRQEVDDGACVPEFPVFSKPEWGQNSHGVAAVHDSLQLDEVRRTRKNRNVSYLLQEASKEKREFEIFYLRSPKSIDNYAILSITETVNIGNKPLPVNGVLNRETRFREINSRLSPEELEKIWSFVGQIGQFKIARVGLCAESVGEMVAGKLHIFEINIFLPMPLVLLDPALSFDRKQRFIRECMRVAAILARGRDRGLARHPVFFKQLLAHYQVKR